MAGRHIVIALTCIAVLFGCGKSDNIDKKDIIAYVNKEPILGSELRAEVDMRARQDPSFKLTPETESDQLDVMITKKIITQGAIKAGLARQDKFVNAIRTFWEQTLIREFIDYKNEEFKKKVVVTNDDVVSYYANLSERVTFKVLKSKNKKYIQDAYSEFLKNNASEIIPWGIVGPVGYDELGPGILMDAFSKPVGEAVFFDEDPNYYLVLIAAREQKTLEPLESIKPDIEKRLLELKDRAMFEDWLDSEKKKAKIKVIGQ
ncbi:MAG: hypothetical protein WC779_02795 [Candidatus Omnitrophota bacterium]